MRSNFAFSRFILCTSAATSADRCALIHARIPAFRASFTRKGSQIDQPAMAPQAVYPNLWLEQVIIGKSFFRRYHIDAVGEPSMCV